MMSSLVSAGVLVTCVCVCVDARAYVGGESGSADTVRDPRGFAVKFYTEDGNWDLVGNNTPIFFIRDPILVRGMKLKTCRSHDGSCDIAARAINCYVCFLCV